MAALPADEFLLDDELLVPAVVGYAQQSLPPPVPALEQQAAATPSNHGKTKGGGKPCFVCQTPKKSGNTKFCVMHKRVTDAIAANAQAEKNAGNLQPCEDWNKALNDQGFCQELIDDRLAEHPQLGEPYGRAPPLDWAQLHTKVTARTSVRQESVYKLVDRIDFGNMKKKRAWLEPRIAQEWKKWRPTLRFGVTISARLGH
jgi:hypothetical protein